MFILVLLQTAARTDIGSNGVEPASIFVIKNHQITYSMSCPMQAVGMLLKRGLRFFQWRRTRNPMNKQDLIVNGQLKSRNIILQEIDLNPNCLQQSHFNRFDTSHGYESTELGCFLTKLRVSSVIRLLGDTRLARSIQMSSRPKKGSF